jgi:hypothetical protein
MPKNPIRNEGFGIFMDFGFDEQETAEFHREVLAWAKTPDGFPVLQSPYGQNDLEKVSRKYVQSKYPELDLHTFADDENAHGYVVFVKNTLRLTTSEEFVSASIKAKKDLESFKETFLPQNRSGFYQWENARK